VDNPNEIGRPSEGSDMDPIAHGPALPLWPLRTSASRDPGSELYAPAGSEPSFAADLTAALDSSPGHDPADQQKAALHLLSHIDASCFISLLQILDPKPDDYQARAQYKRYYHKLESVLTLPVPTKEP
jgi:hypothetical protein